MPQPLTFRKSYGRIVLAAACAAAVGVTLLWYLGVVAGVGGRAHGAGDLPAAGVAVLAALVGLVGAVNDRVIVDERTLTVRRFLRRKVVRWDDVAEVAAPWGISADVPLVLKLRPPRPEGWLGRLWRRRVAVPGGWRNHESLVREILRRAPHATVCERLRAHLEAPSHVPWSHRLFVLLALALAVGLVGYALADALAQGVIGILPGALAVATAAPCAVTGRSMGREWRAKRSLVAAYPVPAFSLLVAFLPAMVSGHSEWLLLLLAGCLGWAAATFLICLPFRPRAWQAAAIYAAAVAAALAATWWLGIREPIPAQAITSLRTVDNSLIWSPDGHTLGLQVTDESNGRWNYLVVGGPHLRTWRFPVRDIGHQFHFIDPGHVLYLSRVIFRDADMSLNSISKLWLWDAATHGQRRIPVPARVRLAPEGYTSPDGRLLAFLAEPETAGPRWRLHFLDLAELRVRQADLDTDLSPFERVRWTPGGTLVFTAVEEASKVSPGRISLWSLAPGASKPVRFYAGCARDIGSSFSPDGRWALIALDTRADATPRYDLVDLADGRSRPLALPDRPRPFEIRWSPDGKAFAYPSRERGHPPFILAEAGTGTIRRPCAFQDGRIDAVALSAGARFAACTVRCSRATLVRVVETDTGRVLYLRRPMLVPPILLPVWSPVGQTLAVVYHEKLLPPGDQTVRLCLYNLEAGW